MPEIFCQECLTRAKRESMGGAAEIAHRPLPIA